MDQLIHHLINNLLLSINIHNKENGCCLLFTHMNELQRNSVSLYICLTTKIEIANKKCCSLDEEGCMLKSDFFPFPNKITYKVSTSQLIPWQIESFGC